jgi:hypothetical protein
MDIYWNISILGVVFKLLMTVVTLRMQNVCQSGKTIRRSQGGFMPGDNCPLQIASIFHIASPRLALGLPTYARFIDVQRPNDTIPHELPISKLEGNGITVHLLSFFNALNRDNILQLKTGEAPGVLSDPIPIKRGQRQGCPAPPIFLNIFINDIFDRI